MKPGGLVIALGKGKPGEEEEEPAEGGEPSADFDEAAGAAFEALQAGDLEQFKINLKSAIMSCEDY